MRLRSLFSTVLATASLIVGSSLSAARSQSIVPASDGTGTVVTIDGNHFTIDGGSFSGDGANLFHSFEQFGLSATQVAEFLSQPQIQTILARVVGGDRSFINGLIELSGGNSHLYLLNPAGIVFGPEASLNLPGDFFATTATGIGFDDNRWFDAFGNNDYADLTGTPTQFAFDAAQPGSIVSTGHLTLAPGQNLTLLGGSVLNTGTLASAGGNILVSAVPGTSKIRISQPGHLLSLEIELPRDKLGQAQPFDALDLPALLTGIDGLTAIGNRQVQLDRSGTTVPLATGTALSAGTLAAAGTTGSGGTVHVLGENVALLDQARVDVSGDTGGGIVRLGGDYLGGGTVPNAQYNFGSEDATIQADARVSGAGGTVIVWADEATRFYGNISARGGSVGGDGGFVETSGRDYLDVAGAAVDAGAPLGDPGEWLLDPRNITITNVTSGGSFSGGDPTIFTPTNDSATVNVADILSALAGGSSVTIATGSTGSQDGDITVASTIDAAIVSGNLTLTLNAADDIFVNADIKDTDIGGTDTLNVRLIAGGNIDTTSATIDTSRDGESDQIAGSILLQAGGSIAAGPLNARANSAFNNATGGNVSLTAGASPGNPITFTTIDTTADGLITSTGGDVTINAYGLVQGTGTLPAGSTINTFGNTSSGTIGITHDGGGENVPFVVGSATTNGTVGELAGSGVLTSGSFPILANGGLAAGTPAGISITSINNAPVLSFADGTFSATDPDLDNVTITVTTTAELLTAIASDGAASATLSVPVGTELPITECLLDCGANEILPIDDRLLETPAASSAPLDPGLEAIETAATQEFVEYFDLETAGTLTLAEAQSRLQRIAERTGTNPAVVYVLFSAAALGDRPTDTLVASQTLFRLTERGLEAVPNEAASDRDFLQLVLVTADEAVVVRQLPAVTRAQVLQQAGWFRRAILSPRRSGAFLSPARQLYEWAIAPLEPALQAREIDHIAFVLHSGLRSLPIAALHDGENFLIERYAVSLMPSLSLTDTRYRDVRNAEVLAMGASEFADYSALPAVPLELAAIDRLWDGTFLLNADFTVERLKDARQQTPYGIVHLGTHGAFQAGKPEQSYIVFGDRRLPLTRLRELSLSEPAAELLVLSACRTALGDREAELGFAGLAVAAGVKSALGSLWFVDDTGTLALMGSFYDRLREAPIKVEALRQAQLALLRGETRLADGNLFFADTEIPLTPELAMLGDRAFQHPYFWSGFTLIGSPW